MNAREKWLLSILTGIFVIQAGVFIGGTILCSRADQPQVVCPDLGDRFDNTFATMIATTLALLTGSTLAAGLKKEEKQEAEKPFIPPTPGRQ